jgi:hypothetical protein
MGGSLNSASALTASFLKRSGSYLRQYSVQLPASRSCLLSGIGSDIDFDCEIRYHLPRCLSAESAGLLGCPRRFYLSGQKRVGHHWTHSSHVYGW